jgi:hypothetical protein
MASEIAEVTATAVSACAPAGTARDATVSARVLARIEASIPDSTQRAYRGDWKRFAAWCEENERTAMPATAETLAEYASHLADLGRAPNTIARALSSVRIIHDLGGQPQPSLRAAHKALKAYRGERADAGLPNASPASAMPVTELRKASASLDPGDIRQMRDQVVLVLTWAMMSRRSTMSQLNIGDVAQVPRGLDITVRKSKTDQDARGRTVAVPFGSDPVTCPVRITLAWISLLASKGITDGPLLRPIDRHGRIAGEPGIAVAGRRQPDSRLTGHSINAIIQRVGRSAGVDIARLTAHSMRAGGASGAHLGGADLLTIGRHGGWHDGSASLLGYIRDVDRWDKNPMFKAGL